MNLFQSIFCQNLAWWELDGLGQASEESRKCVIKNYSEVCILLSCIPFEAVRVSG